MKNNGKNICVFCSSSNTLDKIFYEDAEILGGLLAKHRFNLVYGGSNIGTMYSVAKKVKENGGKVYGVMPERLYGFNVHSTECDEFFITKDMRDRKSKLDELSDGVIAMAGGFGTLEEVSEIICHKQLGYHNKPIIFLNTEGFYDNLLKFFDKICEKSFARESAKNIFYVANTPQDAVNYLLNYDYVEKEVKPEEIYTTIH